MGQIRMTPEMMHQRAGEYRTQAGAVQDVIGRMDNLLNQLQSEWEGQASQAYEGRWKGDLKPSFQKAKDLIDEIAKSLDTAAQNVDTLDREMAAQLNSK